MSDYQHSAYYTIRTTLLKLTFILLDLFENKQLNIRQLFKFPYKKLIEANLTPYKIIEPLSAIIPSIFSPIYNFICSIFTSKTIPFLCIYLRDRAVLQVITTANPITLVYKDASKHFVISCAKCFSQS